MSDEGVRFRQSLSDFPLMVSLDKKLPSFGLHRNKHGLRFLPLDDEGFTVRGDKRRLLYKGRRRSHRFTILGDTSFEYDCILEREPDTNVISLLIDGGEHFDFFKQPDFVKDLFLRGSYAVYKKNTFVGEGTGKLCHIHRPLIIDALGRRVWGDLTVAGNELRITIPEQWLGEAKYPVVVDPVVGTTTIGAYWGFYDDNYIEDYYDEELDQWFEYEHNYLCPLLTECGVALNRYQIPQDMLGNGYAYVYLYMHKPYINNDKDMDNNNYGIKPCLYSDNNNVPLNRLSANEYYFDNVINKTNKPGGWRSETFSTNQIINAGSYIWYGMHSCVFQPRFDFGAQCYICRDEDEEWEINRQPPEICPVWKNDIEHEFLGTLDIIISMYFNYTPMQHYMRTLTQGIKLTDSPKLTAEYAKKINHSVNGMSVIGGNNAFLRQCVSNVTNSVVVGKSVGFMRSAMEQINILSEFLNYRELFHQIIETVQAGDILQRVQNVCRGITDSVTADDTVYYPIVFVRSMQEETHFTDTIQHCGEYIRGLYDISGNAAETERSGDYSKKVIDTVQAEGMATRGLLFFVRIITHVFIRDFLLRRFLIAREELMLKSYICRNMVIESKIN